MSLVVRDTYTLYNQSEAKKDNRLLFREQWSLLFFLSPRWRMLKMPRLNSTGKLGWTKKEPIRSPERTTQCFTQSQMLMISSFPIMFTLAF